MKILDRFRSRFSREGRQERRTQTASALKVALLDEQSAPARTALSPAMRPETDPDPLREHTKRQQMLMALAIDWRNAGVVFAGVDFAGRRRADKRHAKNKVAKASRRANRDRGSAVVWFLVAALTLIALGLAVYAAIGYVAVHFIAKWW